MYTLPRSIRSQSAGWQTGSLLVRSRIWGRKLPARFAVCKTIRIAASTSCGYMKPLLERIEKGQIDPELDHFASYFARRSTRYV